jgi:hypothetical protein
LNFISGWKLNILFVQWSKCYGYPLNYTWNRAFMNTEHIFYMYISYQSTDAIRKRHLYIHISRLMQSENGILLLFYIFLSNGNEEKKWKRGVGCKKGGCCVLSTSTCGMNDDFTFYESICFNNGRIAVFEKCVKERTLV